MAYMFLHHGGAHMYQNSQQTRHTKKNKCLQKFPILLALIYYLHVYLCFYISEHVYTYLLTYRKKEFQNILERKLYN